MRRVLIDLSHALFTLMRVVCVAALYLGIMLGAVIYGALSVRQKD